VKEYKSTWLSALSGDETTTWCCPQCPASHRLAPHPSMSATSNRTDMTVRIPEDILAWLVDWSLVTIMGDMLPPRDPNDDDDEDEEDEDEEAEPAIIREPEEEE
jgi:hypothetical protein